MAEVATETRFDLSRFLSSVRPGPTHAAGPLRLVALLGAHDGPDAVLLEEALGAGTTSICEIGEAAIVARVRVDHRGPTPLLLLDGEQIVGAKQNRVMNASFLVAAGQSVAIPVSCVERGRWSSVSPKFGPSDTTLTARARSAKLRRVAASLATGRGYEADQSATWRDVDDYLERTGTVSTTAAFDEAYERRRAHAERILAEVGTSEDQVGLAAVQGRSLVSLDVFGSPSLYTRAWKKIARGLFAETYGEETAATERRAVAATRAALRAIGKSRSAFTPAPGSGETLHAASRRVTFTGIVGDGALYHLAAVGGRTRIQWVE